MQFNRNALSPECPDCASRKLKARARAATHAAIRSGLLVRQRCVDCVAEGHAERDRPVQAHHGDYSRPLEVTWLCSNHHQYRHMLPRDAKGKIVRVKVVAQ